MRILHVNKFLYRRGGAEAYMLDLAQLQQDLGHEVHYFAMQHPENLPSSYEQHFPSHVELDPMPTSPVQRLRTAARMIHSREARRGIEAVLDSARPDVVHLHNIYHQLSPSVLGPIAARGIPAVMTLHDYKLTCPTYRFLANGRPCTACVTGGFQNAVRKRCQNGSLAASTLLAVETAIHARTAAYGSIRMFLCPSRFLMGQMIESGVYPHRMRHVDNFAFATGSAQREKTRGLVLFAGRLSPEKGVDVLIDAAPSLSPDAHIEIAGAGPARDDLERRAIAVAPGRIRFLGHLAPEDLHARMAAAHVVVLPARWYENQPMSVLEAMATGTAVVVTDMGGLPELVDERTGAVVPPEDPAALARAVDRLAGDDALAAACGAAAREVALTRFSPDAHVARVIAAYEEVR